MNTLQRRDATRNEQPSAHATRGSASVDTRRIHLVIRSSDRVRRVSAALLDLSACSSARCALQAARVHPVNTRADACPAETIELRSI